MPYADAEKRKQYHHDYYMRHRALSGPHEKTEEHVAKMREGAARFCRERAEAHRTSGGMRGYPYRKVDGELVRENRYAWEQANGRALRDNEIIHHIDGDRFNNDPSNLVAMTQAEHARLHHTKRTT